MKDLMLDSKGDLMLATDDLLYNDLQYVSGVNLVKQEIQQVLSTNKGEWALNPDEGIDFWAILTKNPNYDQIYDTVLDGIHQIDEGALIKEYSSELKNRHLEITFTIQLSSGQEFIFVLGEEKTIEKGWSGVAPLHFKAIGTQLLDWIIKGAAGGVGIAEEGINYLRQVESSMPDGTYGKQVNAVYSDSTARTGTFNSGTATNISFRFNANDSPITPQDIGKIILSDGTTEVKLDILSGHIGSLWIDEGDYPLTVQCGDDGTGRIVVYSSGDLPALGKWCYTKKVDITPNTDYTFERIGGIENVKIQYITSKEVGHVNTAWSAPLKSIPGNQTPDKNIEQWTTMTSSRRYWETSTVYTYLDSRPATYEFCSYYADLQPGRYKVIAEGYGNNWGYTYMRNVDMSRDQTPYMALIAEDDTPIIQRRNIFSDTSSPFHHEEYEFTISAPTKVGLYFKAINTARSDYGNYTRFMIVDYDVVAEPFIVDISGGGTLSGVTCWEPYKRRYYLPITISNGEQTETYTIDLPALLYEGESISYASTGQPLPVFEGITTIDVESNVKPEVYVKYSAIQNVIYNE